MRRMPLSASRNRLGSPRPLSPLLATRADRPLRSLYHVRQFGVGRLTEGDEATITPWRHEALRRPVGSLSASSQTKPFTDKQYFCFVCWQYRGKKGCRYGRRRLNIRYTQNTSRAPPSTIVTKHPLAQRIFTMVPASGQKCGNDR